ncbi:hypothetical protein HPB50_023043 [Hyalomma asiaticum]|uniref:Uncharacterized protein n=1 Tax=Hyalomma asiaticum TaxID=266040 RepID=A0ACB7SHA1_HYAAI|nr:hypothetical protein HPB50_023043 [Hyalomma asiaticum]
MRRFGMKDVAALVLVCHILLFAVLFYGNYKTFLQRSQLDAEQNTSAAVSTEEPVQGNKTSWKISQACRTPSLRILYFVHTAPTNIERRRWIRKTLDDPIIAAQMNSAIAFFVGEAPELKDNETIVEEALREGDIVVLNFTDTYKNLSHKFLQGAKWVADHCRLGPTAVIVKLDDDVLVNLPALSAYLTSGVMALTGIHCAVLKGAAPFRTQKSKWYVSKNDYPLNVPMYGWKTSGECRNPGLRILCFVHTTPEAIGKRQWLRKTIGVPHVRSLVNSSTVFFVGASPDQQQQLALQDEAIQEGDLVLLNFTESRRNLSYKFFLGARWILKNCHLASDVTLVKMDEDILVNIFALSSYVSSSLMWLSGIHGVVYAGASPQRKPTSEWYASKEEYASDVYPNYCAGQAIIMKLATLSTLVDASVLVPYFWIEDVYVTGIVADFANVNLVDLSRHIILEKHKNLVTVGDATLFVHMRSAGVPDDKRTSLWEAILRSNQSGQRDFRTNVEVYYRRVS